LILGPLLCRVYINDFPKAIEHKVIPILFTVYASKSVTIPNNIQFQKDFHIVFGQINKWCNGNLLSLNLNITSFMQFINKSTRHTNYVQDKQIRTATETKFLGLLINNTFFLFENTH